MNFETDFICFNHFSCSCSLIKKTLSNAFQVGVGDDVQNLQSLFCAKIYSKVYLNLLLFQK